ncbi:SH3 domain-containing protein [Streptococcus pluranimalium]|uniref:SH3 domain-containing protein n=1 Tax=Streptococcus pluranimalium TaxID=82348 RepID=UPI003F68FED3
MKDLSSSSSVNIGGDGSTGGSTTGTSLPSSGTYYFTSRKGIKSEPKISSPDIAYYDIGNSVNYDKTLVSDNYEWISYISYSGSRRYIAINKLNTSSSPITPKVKGTITIQNQNNQIGTFDVIIKDISSNSGLKEVRVPIWSTKDNQDDIVWYKASKEVDGTYKLSVNIANHKNNRGEYNIHLYYVIDSGKQIGVGGTKINVPENQSSNVPAKPSIPNSGTYTFSGHASIKAEPKVSAPELAYYDTGNSVNYDSVVLSDGHYWISYIAVSGNRRYISIT